MRIPEVCPVVKETAEDSLYKGYVHMAVHIQSGSVWERWVGLKEGNSIFLHKEDVLLE